MKRALTTPNRHLGKAICNSFDSSITILGAVVVLLASGLVNHATADSGVPPGLASYESEGGEFILTVDPRRSQRTRRSNPLLTLASRSGEVIWERTPTDFEEFRYPLDACVSRDGRYLVFGGVSVHNLGKYYEGLRFYDEDGRLLRFISRRDLPRGYRGVSTSLWYDDGRTRIEEYRFFFFTPGISEPMVFDVRNGKLLEGAIVEGQGDDRDWFQKESIRNPSGMNNEP